MKKPSGVFALTQLGRVRLSEHFFMREMLYSEVAHFHGKHNIPDDPDLAIAAGSALCEHLLEPLHATFGHVSIRSAYRSHEVNRFCNEQQLKGGKGYTCRRDSEAHHVWDRRDSEGYMGATACIVIPWFLRYLQRRPDMSWTALAWWIHDHLPYSEMCFFPKYFAFNIRWHERPDAERKISSHVDPLGMLTHPGAKNHFGDHSSEYPGFPGLRSS